MKKLLLLALITMMMVGCDTEMPDGTYRPIEGSYKTYVLDSCEYFGVLDLGNADFLSHKGNCKFCAERRKRLEASDYMISVKRNQLRVRFNVMYGKKK